MHERKFGICIVSSVVYYYLYHVRLANQLPANKLCMINFIALMGAQEPALRHHHRGAAAVRLVELFPRCACWSP